MDYEGVTRRRRIARRAYFPYAFLACGLMQPTAQRLTGGDWVEKALGWTVVIVWRPRKKPAPEEALMASSKQWTLTKA